jgi:hypothetical protein
LSALVPGMAKEKSKMIHICSSEMLSLFTNTNAWDHLSTVLIKFVFRSSIFAYIFNTIKFVKKFIFI